MDGVGATRDVTSGAEGEGGFGETGMIRGASGAMGDNGIRGCVSQVVGEMS